MKKLALYSGWIFSIVLVGIMFFGWNYTNTQLRAQADNYTANYAVLNATYEGLRTDYNNLTVASANTEAQYNAYITALNTSFAQQQLQWNDTLNSAMAAKDAQWQSTLNTTLIQRDGFWNTTLATTLANRDATWQTTMNATMAARDVQWQGILANTLAQRDAQWQYIVDQLKAQIP
ncbi:MAG: hypothetical protein Q7R50_02885 [Dehalococcoidales bacterium]|nr:hypothetical protein [Dehalococcoidales bacterium]